MKRVDISNKLNKIRKFRNRINHNEPICFNGNKIDLDNCEEIYNSIICILKWINPETMHLLKNIDEVSYIINISKNINS